jgi:hypothetical protein
VDNVASQPFIAQTGAGFTPDAPSDALYPHSFLTGGQSGSPVFCAVFLSTGSGGPALIV